MGWMLSPRAQKAQEEARGRDQARAAFFTAGPHLANGEIVIPSPAPHPTLNPLLKSLGFRFYGGEYPQWSRPTAQPHKGKVWSPQAWLTSSRNHYAQAWPGLYQPNN